jgi:hypothetical protein
VTGLLERAAAWFVTPIGSPPATPDPEPVLRVAREDELVDLAELGYGEGRFVAPVAHRAGPPAPAPAMRAPTERVPAAPAPMRVVPVPAPIPGAAVARPLAPTLAAEPPRAVVLGPTADVLVAAAALALDLRRRGRTGAAVVVPWSGDDAPGPTLPAPALAAPGLPAARLLAARLGRRGVTAGAHGRLVWCPLAGTADAAGAEHRRIAAASGDAPVVLALLGARSAAGDALLVAHDGALLAAEPGSPLTELAAADLGRAGVPLRAWAPPAAGAARAAALAGWRAPAGVPELAGA